MYQRILDHLQDNLLQKDSKLNHDGEISTTNEEINPTVERLAVLRWIELIHPKIPTLVQRTFAYDLQHATLKDLQPPIADALDGFMDEIQEEEARSDRVRTRLCKHKPTTCDDSEEDAYVARTFTNTRYIPRNSSVFNHKGQYRKPGARRTYKQCIICKMAGRKSPRDMTIH